MNDLRRLLPAEMDELVTSAGFPRYRADQILRALWKEGRSSLAEITVLPAALRERLLKDGYGVGATSETSRSTSPDGETHKVLLRMSDGTLIESVLMQYPEEGRHPRSTVCVSTQAGCAMGCLFCATGQMGFERNLTAEEMVAEVMHFAQLLRGRGQHITNIVFMGMGEPLANYAETIRTVRLLTDPRALGLAQRSITISTVGLLRGIQRLADEGLQVGLAISLHAPNDELRCRLVPAAAPNSVGSIMKAAASYFATTGRRVTFEYALLKDVNDSPAIARELAALVAGTGVHVNLIPVNPTTGGFARPERARTLEFERILRAAGVNCTVRVEKGSDIAAACGQLRTEAAPPGVARRISPKAAGLASEAVREPLSQAPSQTR